MHKQATQTADIHPSRFDKRFAKTSRSFVNAGDKRDMAYKTMRWKTLSVHGCVYSIYTPFYPSWPNQADRMKFHIVFRAFSIFLVREMQTVPVCPIFLFFLWTTGNIISCFHQSKFVERVDSVVLFLVHFLLYHFKYRFNFMHHLC